MIFGRHYGELLPLDLCVRLADQQQQLHQQQTLQQQPDIQQTLQQHHNDNNTRQQQQVILEPQTPASPTYTECQIKSLSVDSGGNPRHMRTSPLTPSPSSSSSQDNEDDMGYLGPSQFSIFRRQAAPVQVITKLRLFQLLELLNKIKNLLQKSKKVMK